MGSAEPCSSWASKSDGIRGFLASTASSHNAGASLATDAPNSCPSSWAACTALDKGTPTAEPWDRWPGRVSVTTGCGPRSAPPVGSPGSVLGVPPWAPRPGCSGGGPA
jgi:hypothetical protein